MQQRLLCFIERGEYFLSSPLTLDPKRERFAKGVLWAQQATGGYRTLNQLALFAIKFDLHSATPFEASRGK